MAWHLVKHFPSPYCSTTYNESGCDIVNIAVLNIVLNICQHCSQK